jgi:glucose-1-phosphate adenylyltransferase
MGIYVFNRDLLVTLMNQDDAQDFGREIIPQSIHTHRILSYQFEGYWTDIGNIQSFYDAMLALTEDIPRINLFDSEKNIYTRPRLLPPSKITGTTFDRAVVTDGCIIAASRIERSVIGLRSRIGKDTVIINAYVMGNDFYQTLDQIGQQANGGIAMGIGERCLISNCIVDKNCHIGNDVRVQGGAHLQDANHELYFIKDGIVVIKKGAVIPQGYEIVASN